MKNVKNVKSMCMFAIAILAVADATADQVGDAIAQIGRQIAISQGAVEQKAPRKTIASKITKATYGASGRFIDVTTQVKGIVAAGTSETALNVIGGDPIFGTVKHLTVSFSNMPDVIIKEKQGIYNSIIAATITKALYGASGIVFDVTSKVKNIVINGQSDTASNDLAGDPIPEAAKQLTISFSNMPDVVITEGDKIYDRIAAEEAATLAVKGAQTAPATLSAVGLVQGWDEDGYKAVNSDYAQMTGHSVYDTATHLPGKGHWDYIGHTDLHRRTIKFSNKDIKSNIVTKRYQCGLADAGGLAELSTADLSGWIFDPVGYNAGADDYEATTAYSPAQHFKDYGLGEGRTISIKDPTTGRTFSCAPVAISAVEAAVEPVTQAQGQAAAAPTAAKAVTAAAKAGSAAVTAAELAHAIANAATAVKQAQADVKTATKGLNAAKNKVTSINKTKASAAKTAALKAAKHAVTLEQNVLAEAEALLKAHEALNAAKNAHKPTATLDKLATAAIAAETAYHAALIKK